MDEIIKRHRAMVAERLTQGFSPVHRDAISKAEEYDDIEKARVVRQDGDIHPNGKWVWSSQAAGGKGDWRVIKKPKDGSPTPAPAKKETKSANAPALSSEALMKTLENMSAEDLIKLQSLIANAVAKKTKSADVTKESGEKMSEAIGSVLAQGIKATKRYNLAPDGSPIDLTKLPDQNIITAVVLVQENVDKLAYEATLGGGKKKQEKIAQELEDQRGKLAELQEEADRRGLKNESSKEKEASGGGKGVFSTRLNGHDVEIANREYAERHLNCSAEKVWNYQDGSHLAIIKMTKQDQADWNKDFGFDLEPDKYPNDFVWMVEQEGSYYLFDNEDEAIASATAIANNDGDFAEGRGFDEVSTDGTHVRAVDEQISNDEFMTDLRRTMNFSKLKSSGARQRAKELFLSAREKFGDKASVKLGPYNDPFVSVSFESDLHLTLLYKEDKNNGDEVWVNWQFEDGEESFYSFAVDKFDVNKDIPSVKQFLDDEIRYAERDLQYLKRDNDDPDQADIDDLKIAIHRLETLKKKYAKGI
jgi:hypothetical protein